MNKLRAVTEFIVWLLFVSTILLTITLLITGTYQLITEPTWQTLNTFIASIITLAMHYAVRLMPIGTNKGGK